MNGRIGAGFRIPFIRPQPPENPPQEQISPRYKTAYINRPFGMRSLDHTLYDNPDKDPHILLRTLDKYRPLARFDENGCWDLQEYHLSQRKETRLNNNPDLTRESIYARQVMKLDTLFQTCIRRHLLSHALYDEYMYLNKFSFFTRTVKYLKSDSIEPPPILPSATYINQSFHHVSELTGTLFAKNLLLISLTFSWGLSLLTQYYRMPTSTSFNNPIETSTHNEFLNHSFVIEFLCLSHLVHRFLIYLDVHSCDYVITRIQYLRTLFQLIAKWITISLLRSMFNVRNEPDDSISLNQVFLITNILFFLTNLCFENALIIDFYLSLTVEEIDQIRYERNPQNIRH